MLLKFQPNGSPLIRGIFSHLLLVLLMLAHGQGIAAMLPRTCETVSLHNMVEPLREHGYFSMARSYPSSCPCQHPGFKSSKFNYDEFAPTTDSPNHRALPTTRFIARLFGTGILSLKYDGLPAVAEVSLEWKSSFQRPPPVAPNSGAVGEGTKVFRVWGDEAGASGRSWTTVDPRTVPNYRNAAGLPVQNSGRFISEGVLSNTQGVTTRGALPLHGNAGGLSEVIVPNPTTQIRLQNVQGLNPEF